MDSSFEFKLEEIQLSAYFWGNPLSVLVIFKFILYFFLCHLSNPLEDRNEGFKTIPCSTMQRCIGVKNYMNGHIGAQ